VCQESPSINNKKMFPRSMSQGSGSFCIVWCCNMIVRCLDDRRNALKIFHDVCIILEMFLLCWSPKRHLFLFTVASCFSIYCMLHHACNNTLSQSARRGDKKFAIYKKRFQLHAHKYQFIQSALSCCQHPTKGAQLAEGEKDLLNDFIPLCPHV